MCTVWSADTSYYDNWTPQNPARGQCAVTAMLIQDLFGGEILRGLVVTDSHYWNRLPDGTEVDLTFGQFPPGSVIICRAVASRADLEANPDTVRRYEHLCARVAARAGDQ